MSAGRRLPAWWWLPALLWGGAGGYVVVSSVSWPLPEGGTAADELHSSSTEEALPALLEEAGGLWKQSYPASAYREDAALGSGPAARRSGQGAAPSRMFSYRREGGGALGRAGTARFLARYNTWGFVATRAAQRKIQGMPYGNCLLLSDGPVNNSTGIPFFYVTPKDNTVADLLKNPMASLTLPEADGNFCSSRSDFRLTPHSQGMEIMASSCNVKHLIGTFHRNVCQALHSVLPFPHREGFCGQRDNEEKKKGVRALLPVFGVACPQHRPQHWMCCQ
ncbi:protein CREG2 isoform X4 [Balearica regulorum gibbericeps]|uniref:protein CREG2 isoform X4 n=1 Tax=Balearica regulorum gibbericeps TaxID=100784 RepID=UPI003F5E5B5E